MSVSLNDSMSFDILDKHNSSLLETIFLIETDSQQIEQN